MKQILIVSGIIIVIIFIAVFTNFYLESSANTIVSNLDNIEKFSKANDWNNALKELSLLDKDWDKTQSIWAILIEHQEIDNIDISLKKVEKYVETKNLSNVLAEIAATRLLINHIPQTFSPNIVNIF